MKTYANTRNEITLTAFDFEADYNLHLENLKSEVTLQDHRNLDLNFDDLDELFLLLEFGDNEE
jgi:hypothetical protein